MVKYIRLSKKTILLWGVIFYFSNCDQFKHTIQNWSFEHRTERRVKINEEDLKRWQSQLNVSEEDAKKIYEHIYNFAEKKKLQGELSWKIGKALLEQGSYELATEYFKESFEGKISNIEESKIYESALPFFQKALLNYKPLPDLLYDAGICYGNASRVLGWEDDRLKTALFILERGYSTYPDDIRFAYSLGILYGKIPEKYRDIDKSIFYLDAVIKKDRYHITAYFAKGNILSENAKFQEAFYVYEEITKVIEEMYNKNFLKGNPTKNPQYQRAIDNMKELQICIEGKPACKIQQN